jgi:hypothetical protein
VLYPDDGATGASTRKNPGEPAGHVSPNTTDVVLAPWDPGYPFGMLTVIALSLAAVSGVPPPAREPAPVPIVDPGTVQGIAVAELLAAPNCAKPVAADGHLCGPGRRLELRRGERDRALALLNSAGGAARKCQTPATHAFIITTTKGVRVVEVSFRCHTIGDRAFVLRSEQDVASFFRGQGLVQGL